MIWNCVRPLKEDKSRYGVVRYRLSELYMKEKRVILFDIDGTLVRTVRRGEYRFRVRDMLMEIFGTCGRIAEVDFAGKTDLAIYREALECEGINPDAIRELLPQLEAAMVGILDDLA
jgi:FMN phosphatase YigB (HAD superfamily)